MTEPEPTTDRKKQEFKFHQLEEFPCLSPLPPIDTIIECDDGVGMIGIDVFGREL
jgi:hypothetical protein